MFGHCFVLQYLVSFLVTLIVCLMSCKCYCSVADPLGAVGWSADRGCGIF